MDRQPGLNRSFKLESVVERCVGNVDLAVKLLHRFKEMLDTDVPRLGQAIRDAITSDVAETAHRIKGSAAALGIEGVRQRAAAVEAAAKSGNLTASVERLEALERAAREYRADVARNCPGAGAGEGMS